MHPLNTLIESQRNQLRQQRGRPTPRRRSETQEYAIVVSKRRNRSRVAVALTLLTNRLTGR
jgi:hypothetical protein